MELRCDLTLVAALPQLKGDYFAHFFAEFMPNLLIFSLIFASTARASWAGDGRISWGLSAVRVKKREEEREN